MQTETKRISVRLSAVATKAVRAQLGDRLMEAAKAAIQHALDTRNSMEVANAQFTFDGILLAWNSRRNSEGKLRVYFDKGIEGVPDFITTEDEFRRREKAGVERVREERRMGGVRTVRI